MTDDGSSVQEQYRFRFDEKSNQLFAVVMPAVPSGEGSEVVNPQRPPSLASVQQRLEKEGFADFFFPPSSLDHFFKHLRNQSVGEYPLAEKRDAKIRVSLSRDNLSARVQTDKAWGGTPLSQELIKSELEKAGIAKSLIDRKKLKTLLSSQEALDLIIARATPAQNGSDARFEALVASKVLAQWDVDSKQAIDQHEVYEFLVVDIGTPLMKKIPATQGVEGLDVRGKPIKAKAGADLSFAEPFHGVEVCASDEQLLISTIKGHPIVTMNGVRVDPVMTLKAVDLHSGNVEYDGSLVVTGDIEAGYTVAVTGDVLVKGGITKASVSCGGSLEVKGGITADNLAREEYCHLDIAGNVTAKYINHAHVHCKGDINVDEYIMQSRVSVEGYVNLGQIRGRGCLIGGFCSTNSGVSAKVLGSEAFVTTLIELGLDTEKQYRIQKLKQQWKRHSFEEQQLCKILQKIQNMGKPTNVGQVTLDKARKIENTIAVLHKNNASLLMEIRDLESHLKAFEDMSVKVTQNVYPNVIVKVAGQQWSSGEQHRRLKIALSNHKIVAEHLNE